MDAEFLRPANGPPDLEGLDGDVDFSDQAQALYSTDASIYQVKPAGVVAPKTTSDVREIVTYARENQVSVVARGAGSSLTGNAVGDGIVVDFERHLDDVVDVDPVNKTVTVQPGVVLDELNDHLEQYGLYFPPDPSTASTCTIGGMVANDAAGAHSVRHGTTRNNVRAVECVLADGSVERFERISDTELERQSERDDLVGDVYRSVREIATEYRDEIDARYPNVDRNSSGYDLDGAVADDGSWVDLSTLVTGSEGTLGAITEITLELTERPQTRAAVLVFYDDLIEAAAAVPGALEADPSVVELIDDDVLGYAHDAWDIHLIPDSGRAALLLEVETTIQQQKARLEAVIDAARTAATVGVERAVGDEAQEDLWQIRKASNPLLNRQPGPEESLSFVEDAAIPPERLSEYLDAVGDILAAHDLDASVFGHAGQGVLHVKPFLDLTEPRDRERLRSVSESVHALVIEMGGSVSGEHGDGRLRSEYLESMYGSELYEAFSRVKRAFDPDDVFNPATVVPSQSGDLAHVDENLRYDDYDPVELETALDFEEEGGFDSLVDQCNGCSKCRTMDDGVMCPSYRALEDEETSTRGRANMLRETLNGTFGDDSLTSDWFQEEVLDLCLSCKACETECPTGTDMSKLKTEVKHQKHVEDGIPLRSRLFGHIRRLNRLGSLFTPLSNWLLNAGPMRTLLDRALGIDKRRDLPEFASESLESWFADHESAPQAGDHGRVVLLADCYSNYNHPEVGQAAVEVLERAGYAVEMPTTACCGRPALSQGMVEKARRDAKTNASILGDYADEGVPVLSVEPSCTSAFEEYGDLLEDPRGIPAAAMTVLEFLDETNALDRLDLDSAGTSLALHTHCHSKARGRDERHERVLADAGFETEHVDSTCCGMAGSFGYESEHYDMSVSLGEDLDEAIEKTNADDIATAGTSCTHQLTDFNQDPDHPILFIAEELDTA